MQYFFSLIITCLKISVILNIKHWWVFVITALLLKCISYCLCCTHNLAFAVLFFCSYFLIMKIPMHCSKKSYPPLQRKKNFDKAQKIQFLVINIFFVIICQLNHLCTIPFIKNDQNAQIINIKIYCIYNSMQYNVICNHICF